MTNEERNIYRLRFRRFQQSREKFFAPKIQKALNQQIKQFTQAYRNTTDSQALLSITSEPIIKVLRTLYLDAAIVYGAKIKADLIKKGVRHRLSLTPEIKSLGQIGFNERMAQLIKDYFYTDILNTSEFITDTTRDIIQRVLVDSYDDGLGIDDIIKKLEDTELSRARARMIARTETVTAANQGAMFAAKDTGLKMNKEWLATYDERTRHDHRFINGHVVGYDDDFKLPGEIFMSQPGDRTQPSGLPTPAREIVNCRCTIVFEPLRDSKGNLIRATPTFKPPTFKQPTFTPPVFTPPPVYIPTAKPPVVEKVFKPAKTIKEAEEFALNTIGVKYANFKGVNIDIANDINKSVFNIKQVMPDIKTMGVGSAQQANKALKAELVDAYKRSSFHQGLVTSMGQERADYYATHFANKTVNKVGGNTIAWSQSRLEIRIPGGETVDVSKYAGVFVNEKFAKDKTKMDEMIRGNRDSKWFTPSAEDFGYVMSHEIGHEIDKTIGFGKLSEFQAIFDREHSAGINAVIDRLSKYGATAGGRASHKPDEMIAEAWAEFMTSSNPRPLAKEIGELMLRTYHTDYIQGTGVKYSEWRNNVSKIVKQ